ncbi:MAG: hypothetical protein HOP19_08175 [Acidobacteria bacterium]|nr:hypothetical protein [Acidobacteriota bacterium]
MNRRHILESASQDAIGSLFLSAQPKSRVFIADSGLAAAYELAKAGHAVAVVAAQHKLHQVWKARWNQARA